MELTVINLIGYELNSNSPIWGELNLVLSSFMWSDRNLANLKSPHTNFRVLQATISQFLARFQSLGSECLLLGACGLNICQTDPYTKAGVVKKAAG